ncbi:MAG: glutaredoxin domain-containing protein [Holophagae bacterium]
MTRVDTLIVFTADGCPHCRAALADLDRRHVRHRQINLTREPDQIERLRTLCSDPRLPVFLDHERVSVGFRGGSSSLASLGVE